MSVLLRGLALKKAKNVGHQVQAFYFKLQYFNLPEPDFTDNQIRHLFSEAVFLVVCDPSMNEL